MPPQTGSDLGAFVKCLADGGVDYEIEVAIAIAFGDVGEAVVFIGKGEGGFGEHGPFFGVEREFSFVRAAYGSFGADDVAGVGPGF